MLLVGRWEIEAVEDLDVDLAEGPEPAELAIDGDGRGAISFFVFAASIDARFVDDSSFEFSWEGEWELDAQSGRGIARLVGDELHIHMWIHLGDELDLRATRS